MWGRHGQREMAFVGTHRHLGRLVAPLLHEPARPRRRGGVGVVVWPSVSGMLLASNTLRACVSRDPRETLATCFPRNSPGLSTTSGQSSPNRGHQVLEEDGLLIVSVALITKEPASCISPLSSMNSPEVLKARWPKERCRWGGRYFPRLVGSQWAAESFGLGPDVVVPRGQRQRVGGQHLVAVLDSHGESLAGHSGAVTLHPP